MEELTSIVSMQNIILLNGYNNIVPKPKEVWQCLSNHADSRNVKEKGKLLCVCSNDYLNTQHVNSIK